MSTTFGIAQVAVAKPAEQSFRFSANRRKRIRNVSSQGLHDDIVGVAGVVVTLSVVLSGVYVFCRFLT